MTLNANPDARAVLDAILLRLDRGDAPASKWPDAKGEYWALCPFHADKHAANFSVSERGYKCFACGAGGGLAELADRLGVDRLHGCTVDRLIEGVSHEVFSTPSDHANERLHGCTVDRLIEGVSHDIFSLAEYAKAKRLPEDFLRSLGVTERKRGDKVAVRMPYLDTDGREMAVRYRIALVGDRFRWAKGSKLAPYGLWLLPEVAADVILVEGESDTQTLLYHGIPALGIPGAQNWRSSWSEYLRGKTVFAWREPGDAGAQFVAKIGRDIPDLRVIICERYKDISEAHVAGEDIPALLADLKAKARAWRDLVAEETNQQANEARTRAAALLSCPDILAEFARECERLGLVGEDRNAKLLYLALVTRLLDRPVSVAVKGPSAGGKSFTVETVLRFFPQSTYYALSSLSERALAYDQEPLSHRFLVIYEAAGMGGDLATYLLRSLLSENCVRYLTVEKTADGLKPKLIEREGPTGLIVTTTWAALHPENETRLLSLTVRDDQDQTRAVFNALAGRANGTEPQEPDFMAWHALQTWLELAGARTVTIPFAHDLAQMADPRAVRLRRDFAAILALIKAHALLHQAQRGRDDRGRVVATVDDYRAVYDLVIDIVSQGVQATVSQTIRETVEAVAELGRDGKFVTIKQVADHLDIDKSAASRRVRVAIEAGYLVNHQERRNQQAQLGLGDPLPEDRSILPEPVVLEEKISCAIPSINRSTVQPVNRDGGERISCDTPSINRATVQPCNRDDGEKISCAIPSINRATGQPVNREGWEVFDL